ncbi:MAG TPA: hypothetical protein VNH64_02060 [Parvularculaceae bacterium]|nr:hypothetical protein [Parvularculaceae bacterium]
MWSDHELSVIRRVYARQILFLAGVSNVELENAFAIVPREKFLGPPPWKIFRWGSYVTTPDSEPDRIYADVLVGLIPEKGVNNGQPSGHAIWLNAAQAKSGEHAVHIGAGSGYYSAILAELVGPSGRVTAIECIPELAAAATRNLGSYTNVSVRQADGSDFAKADVIYVNAGATRPLDAWLDGLKPGGRLITPLTTDAAFSATTPAAGLQGAVFCITRNGDEFTARVVSASAFIPGERMRDAESEAALAAAFKNGRLKEVTRLYRGKEAAALPNDQCWARAEGWALAYH